MLGKRNNQDLFITRMQYSRRNAAETVPTDEVWVVESKQGPVVIKGGGEEHLPRPQFFSTVPLYKLRKHAIYTESIRLFEATETSLWLKVLVSVMLKDPLAYIKALEQDSRTFRESSIFLHEPLTHALEHLLSLPPQVGETLVSPLAAQDLRPPLLRRLIPTGDITPFINKFLEFRQYGFNASVSIQGIEPSFTYGNAYMYASAELGSKVQSVADWLVKIVPLDASDEVLSLQRLYTAYTNNQNVREIEYELEQVLGGHNLDYRSTVTISRVLLKDLLSSCLRSSLARQHVRPPAKRPLPAISPLQQSALIGASRQQAAVDKQSISSFNTVDLDSFSPSVIQGTADAQQNLLTPTQNAIPPKEVSQQPPPPTKLDKGAHQQSEEPEAELPAPQQLIVPSAREEGEDLHDASQIPSLMLPQNPYTEPPDALTIPEHAKLTPTTLEVPKELIVKGQNSLSALQPSELIPPQDAQADKAKELQAPLQPSELIPPQDAQADKAKELQAPLQPSELIPPQDAQADKAKELQAPLQPSELIPPQDATVTHEPSKKITSGELVPPSLSSSPPVSLPQSLSAPQQETSPSITPQQRPPKSAEQQQPGENRPNISEYNTVKLKPNSDLMTLDPSFSPRGDHIDSSPSFIENLPVLVNQPDWHQDHENARSQQIEQLYSEGGRRWRIFPPPDSVRETLYVDIGDPYTVLIEISERYPAVPPVIEAEDTNRAEKLPQNWINRIVQPLFFQGGCSLYELILAIADDLLSGSTSFV